MQAAAGRRTSRRPDAVAASRVRPGAAASARRAVGQAGAPTRGGKRGPVEVTPQTLAEMLGAPAEPNVEAAGRNGRPGVAAGLCRTAEGGGEVLDIEARRLPGSGALVLIGRQGEVIAGSRRAPRCRGCAPTPHATASTRPSSTTPASSARAVGRGPQGRRLGRRDDGRRAGLRLHAASGPYRRRGDDRRDHPRRTGAPGRRHRREGAGRAPRRVAPCPPAAAQPQSGR